MKNPHLLWLNGIGTVIQLDQRETTSGDYAQLYAAFHVQSGVRRDNYDHAQIVELDPTQCKSGVYWDWELAGPGGASYRLHVLPGTEAWQLQKCKDHIRASYDCVRLLVNRIRRSIVFTPPTLNHQEIDLRA